MLKDAPAPEIPLIGKKWSRKRKDRFMTTIRNCKRQAISLEHVVPRTAFQNSQTGKVDQLCITDSGAVSTAIAGNEWVIIGRPRRMTNIRALDNKIIYAQLPIVTAVTAHDLPTGETIILQVHDAATMP